MQSQRMARLALALALAAAACAGSIEGGAGNGPDDTMGGPKDPGIKPGEDPYAIGPTGLRRLTRHEYDNAIRDLLGDTTRPGLSKLPEDAIDPFDNDYTTQLPSGALIDSIETLAEEAALRLLADRARRDRVVGCTPSGPGDAACLRAFITSFGRLALRRPLADDEIARYLGLQALAIENNDFYTGVELVVRALLQDPEFLYQVEIGTPVPDRPGIVKLGDYELASRLSFFLLGSVPTPALLDLARDGKLRALADRRAAAAALLADPGAAARVNRFHAMWFGYHQLPFPASLARPMVAESEALIQRVVFDRRDYLELFTSTETFVDATLADHYGLPRPASGSAWTPYGQNPRRGILSQGAVLAQGAKFSDTSPTLRGVFVRTRLMCQPFPTPPPNVDVDQPPAATAGPCKQDRYVAHAAGGCAGCHATLDPIGFGLENYDQTGKFRATEAANPACAIAGDGNLVGVGPFNGPAALARLLVDSGALESCAVTQLYRFANGRHETADDAPSLAALGAAFKAGGRRFDQLMIDLAASAAFGHRRLEGAAP